MNESEQINLHSLPKIAARGKNGLAVDTGQVRVDILPDADKKASVADGLFHGHLKAGLCHYRKGCRFGEEKAV